jgi:signal transduction histidine kinase
MTHAPDCERLLRRLTHYRTLLGQALDQQDLAGAAQPAPDLARSIHEHRAAIAQIKVALRERGVPVDDDPDDAAPPPFDQQAIVTALHAALPLDLQPEAARLAQLLTDTLQAAPTTQLPISEPGVAPLIAALAGRQLTADRTVLTFGSDSQLGDVAIRDVVAGHSINLTVNMPTGHAPDLPPTPPANPLAALSYTPCPYPGMIPFRETDARSFFGREGEIRQVLHHLRHRRMLFIIGPSGSGKSSLLAAGVVPRLLQSSLFPPGTWLIRSMRPGGDPVSAIAAALACGDDDLYAAADHLIATSAPATRLLLLIDQVEEIFTQAARAEQGRFIAAIRQLQGHPACSLILSLRADFYGDLMGSDFWPVDPGIRIEIAPLRSEALRQAIQQPAINDGVTIEPALVERLLANAADEPGVLPLIQETMVLLWESRQGNTLTLNTYDGLGADGRSGLAIAVAAKADATYADLTPTQQIVARRVFLRLIQFGVGRADTRRQQSLRSLQSIHDDPYLLDATLRILTDNRLLTMSGAESGERLVDIAHEVIIRGWPALQRWLVERRDAEQMRRRLELKADEWVRLGRGQGGLLDDLELVEAEQWLAGPDALDLGIDPDLPALVSMSLQKGSALEEARAYRDQMRSLYEVAYSLSTTMDYRHVLETALRESRRLVPYTCGFVLLSSGDKDELYVAASQSLSASDQGRKLMVSSVLAAALRATDAQVLDITQHPDLQIFESFHSCRSACIIPLRAALKTYGLMVVATDQLTTFTGELVDMLTVLASYAIISLHNAQIFFDLKEERTKLLSKEEEIRHRLARDLHDGPVSALAAIGMNIEFIKRLLERDPSRVSEELEKLGALVKRTISEVRTILFELRPLVLETQGLKATLEQYLERLQNSRADTTIIFESTAVDDVRLGAKAEGTLFTIVQQAVNNALAHAQAQHIWVRLRHDDQLTVLEVQDDGVGFDMQKVLRPSDLRNSFGMLNMGEQARLIGGDAEIVSAPGTGTKVVITVPISQ